MIKGVLQNSTCSYVKQEALMKQPCATEGTNKSEDRPHLLSLYKQAHDKRSRGISESCMQLSKYTKPLSLRSHIAYFQEIRYLQSAGYLCKQKKLEHTISSKCKGRYIAGLRGAVIAQIQFLKGSM